ncbi:hypothetical protein [Sphingomonas kyeonggiensis]|uniref:ABC-type proline/glycine betaine transport system permease subunit n=1 Tax=Sphingomonas kyeonggiensis TaxID=1268553 RepID=A0A7W6JX01_9SPHN|nr:hypothetical protein [Sphingomonas kyeonggiensis]MBB4100052.1 ABC-type proline/glycine betaine transport system permease subunit [Sphingomonas kyeonggiensis]
MNSMLRGFLIAPAIPGLIVFFIAISQGGFWEGVWAAQGISIVSYIAAIFVGVPLHLFLIRCKKRSLLIYTISGIMSAIIPILLVIIVPFHNSKTSQPLSSLYPLIGVMVLAGGAVAAVFWLIARPDLGQEGTAR